jgi:beta-N-acetylhexosaminidase
MKRPVAVIVLTALLAAGCSDSQSPPSAGPSTVPSSSAPVPTSEQPSTPTGTGAATTRPTPTPAPTATPSHAASCIDQKLQALTLR